MIYQYFSHTTLARFFDNTMIDHRIRAYDILIFPLINYHDNITTSWYIIELSIAISKSTTFARIWLSVKGFDSLIYLVNITISWYSVNRSITISKSQIKIWFAERVQFIFIIMIISWYHDTMKISIIILKSFLWIWMSV